MLGKLNGCIFWLKMMTLGKYHTIWNKASAYIKKEFNSEPLHYNEFFKNKNSL